MIGVTISNVPEALSVTVADVVPSLKFTILPGKPTILNVVLVFSQIVVDEAFVNCAVGVGLIVRVLVSEAVSDGKPLLTTTVYETLIGALVLFEGTTATVMLGTVVAPKPFEP